MNDKITSDPKSQHEHAQAIRSERAEQKWARENPQAKAYYDAIQKLLVEAKPSWFGKESNAEKNSFNKPQNKPVAAVRRHDESRSDFQRRVKSKSGEEGGSITFFVCKDNGDDTTTQGKVTAVATFVATE